MYLLFSSLSVELPCKDSYYYFYNGFFTISNTVVLKEKRAENYQSLAPNEKSQGEHRNKQTRKKNQERTRFLWPDVCRQNTDPKGRPTRQGSSKKIYHCRLLLAWWMARSLGLSGAERNACRSFYATWHTTKCDFLFL